jgi:hypothetical protein
MGRAEVRETHQRKETGTHGCHTFTHTNRNRRTCPAWWKGEAGLVGRKVSTVEFASSKQQLLLDEASEEMCRIQGANSGLPHVPLSIRDSRFAFTRAGSTFPVRQAQGLIPCSGHTGWSLVGFVVLRPKMLTTPASADETKKHTVSCQ